MYSIESQWSGTSLEKPILIVPTSLSKPSPPIGCILGAPTFSISGVTASPALTISFNSTGTGALSLPGPLAPGRPPYFRQPNVPVPMYEIQ